MGTPMILFLLVGVFSGVFSVLMGRRRFTQSIFLLAGLPILGIHLFPQGFSGSVDDGRLRLKYLRGFVKKIVDESRESINTLSNSDRQFIMGYWHSLETAYRLDRLEPLYLHFLELLTWKLGIKPNCHIFEKLLRGEYLDLEYLLID